MAKHLKQNQIKAGMTIYVVSPMFSNISERLVTEPVRSHFVDEDTSWKLDKYAYKPLRHFTVSGKGELSERQNTFYRCMGGKCSEWVERIGYCGDDGIPNKDGVFNYKQDRRAFPTLKKAIAYWVQNQTTSSNTLEI